MFRARVTFKGLTQDEGVSAPADILEEFTHRHWHTNVRSEWDGELLWLEAENDYDADGMALLDEFSDVVVACVGAKGTISFAVQSVREVAHG
jgi:hypothetical protein